MRNLFFLCALLVSATESLASATEKNYVKTHLLFSAGQASMTLPSGSYSDPGMTFSVGRFFHPKITINGHYFLTAAPSGSSNLNGFGVQGKYYFYNTETSFELKHNGGRVQTYDKYFGFGSFGFLDREIRTGKVNISYTGFAASVGGGFKLDYHTSVGIEILRGNLKSASGAITATEATFSNLSVFYSYLF